MTVAPEILEFDLHPMPVPLVGQMAGYFVESTAPINLEDQFTAPQESVLAKVEQVARSLAASDSPQLVIAIHGYGTRRSDARLRYEKIHRYAAQICPPQTAVFLGYLWPSECPKGDLSFPNSTFAAAIGNAFQSLPLLPSGFFWGGIGVSLLTAILSMMGWVSSGFLTPLLYVSVMAFSVLLTLILLRISTYFRDNYRATNYGILDLVELLRQLDQAVVRADTSGAFWDESQKVRGAKEIKLSFIGHSMGCYVVTSTIRILSDVFDQRSIEKQPPSDIGRVFSLSRLVLVAPDIPTEAIMSRRSNFLRSSLRRCEEAYVFCNEADLALRLASTAANYFSLPARTRFSGYRLGNVTATRFQNQGDRRNQPMTAADYGIVNLNQGIVESPYCYLEIRASDREHQQLSEIMPLRSVGREQLGGSIDIPVSDIFTYFDCTDYVDGQGDPAIAASVGKPSGMVSFALSKAALNLWDYGALSLAYFVGIPRSINTHGGFFEGIFSQQLIYQLAFLGFEKMLQSTTLHDVVEGENDATSFAEEIFNQRLQHWSDRCRAKGIQVILSPLRYLPNNLTQPMPPK